MELAEGHRLLGICFPGCRLAPSVSCSPCTCLDFTLSLHQVLCHRRILACLPAVLALSWACIGLTIARVLAGIFSIVVLYRDIQLEKELTQVRHESH